MSEPPQGGSGGARRQLYVVGSNGERHPFLRGMVTHALVKRGLSFEGAYAVARRLRDQLVDREEVSKAEIRDRLEALVGEMFGSEEVRQVGPSRPRLEVVAQGQSQPFSRGLLARSLHAAGLDVDRAYRLVSELQATLNREDLRSVTSDALAERVAALLEQEEDGVAIAARYRVVRRIHRFKRPLVIYLGGAAGTGKSTFALEMAPLLRIYRINATDTIRQVMRMLFSPAILPSIHSSSFELVSDPFTGGDPSGAGETSSADYDNLLTASFEEQAARVVVGARAVVERSIVENMSVVVEGVHLVPPLVPFDDLEGAVIQVPLLLTTLSEEVHRNRFLKRARISGRQAEHYLDHFRRIRALQEHLIEQAEAYGVPVFDTSDGETALPRGLRLVIELLQERLPQLARPEGTRALPPAPTLLLALDGVGDHPVRALGGRTPLEAATIPTLDRLAREGVTGLADPVGPGIVPDTAAGSLALFGQSPQAMKRGPVEALGTGFQPQEGDIALRANLATLDAQGNVTDRRAGRIRDDAAELAATLAGLWPLGEAGVQFLVRVSTEHRLALILRGRGLSPSILGSDPGDGAPAGPPLTPRASDPHDERAVHTARLLAVFEERVREALADHPLNRRRVAQGLAPANAILTRGAGRFHRLTPLEHDGRTLSHACIAGDHTIGGLASWLGGDPITSPAMTANLDTDLDAKFAAALAALDDYDLVVLHLKGADIAAHDRRPELKAKFLSEVDQRLAWLLEHHPGALRVAVASDHATLSEAGHHAADPVPVLIWGTGVAADGVTSFSEAAVAEGGLRRFQLQLLLGRLFDLS
jgi:2,3-bisphosphoglycerate-independent phosphoglycerate mutase